MGHQVAAFVVVNPEKKEDTFWYCLSLGRVRQGEVDQSHPFLSNSVK